MYAENYPDEETLKRIREWPLDASLWSLMALVKTQWWAPDWGWEEDLEPEGTLYRLSTGGWSGNEDLIYALEQNRPFWALCWRMSRRGGGYEFYVHHQEG